MNWNEPASPRAADEDSRGTSAVERAVADFQRGHDRERSFEILFAFYRRRIAGFLRGRVHSEDERLDLTQAIFLRIYQGLEGFRGEGSLDGWVLQIAFNVYRRWRDRQPGGQHAAPEVACDPAGLPEPAVPAPFAAAADSPLDRAVRHERLVALRVAIEALPRQQRLCTELRVYQERSVKEIATALKISPETVKAHLFQARHALAGCLQGAFGALDF